MRAADVLRVRNHVSEQADECSDGCATDRLISSGAQRLSPVLAASTHPSPLDWAQIWAHEFSDAANRSGNSTSQGRPSLPWAQGVAGSNPVAPTNKINSNSKHHDSRHGSMIRRTVSLTLPTGMSRSSTYMTCVLSLALLGRPSNRPI